MVLDKEKQAEASEAFRSMCHKFNPTVNENVGYMFVVLDKDLYHPGDTLEGRLFFEVFLPCFQNRLMFKLECVETFPKALSEQFFSGFPNPLTGVSP